MNIDTKALKAVVDEIEASRTRQKGETEFQREALKAAVKNHKLDAKAIRIVLRRRAMGEVERDEQDYYVHAYELALGGKKAAIEALERGATVREAADIGGISTGAAGNLAKVVQKSSFVDIETGEITKAAPLAHTPCRPQPESNEHSGGRTGTHSESCAALGDEPLEALQAGLRAGTGEGIRTAESLATASDDLAIPQFPRRSAA